MWLIGFGLYYVGGFKYLVFVLGIGIWVMIMVI